MIHNDPLCLGQVSNIPTLAYNNFLGSTLACYPVGGCSGPTVLYPNPWGVTLACNNPLGLV